MTGLGIVGLGQFGQFSAKAYCEIPGCLIRGVYDLNQERTKTLAARFKSKPYSSFKNLIAAKSLQVIIINTPNFLHYPQVKQALLQGKNVFCEKPLCLETSQANELFDIAEKHHLTLSCNHPLIFSPIYQKVKSLLEGKVFGEVKEIIVENYGTEANVKEEWFWDKSKSGGWFLNSTYHFIDLFNYLLGSGKLADSFEHLVTGKTKQTWAELLFNSTKATIFHHLETPAQKASCTIYLKLTEAEIYIFGWVPEKMTINTSKSYNEKVEELILSGGKDKLYQDLIKSSFGDFLSKMQRKPYTLTQEQITKTLRLAIEASEKSK